MRPDYSHNDVPEPEEVTDLDEDATPDEVLDNEEKKKAAEQKLLDELAAAALEDDED
jgi:hypothetical protein